MEGEIPLFKVWCASSIDVETWSCLSNLSFYNTYLCLSNLCPAGKRTDNNHRWVRNMEATRTRKPQ